MIDLTLITTHFYDFLWIELWVEQICKTTDKSAIREILIIDQDRLEISRKKIQRLEPRIRVLQYPKSEAHFAIMEHDHPAVLNAAVLEAQGKYICIFDSDAHPVSSNWLNKCDHLLRDYDAILAKEISGPNLSHPCFMLFKQEHRQIPLIFDDKTFTEGMDTGRLIASQLKSANQRVYLAEPTPAFSGYWGSIYIESIYHHGQGSFHGGGPRLTAQINWANKYFRKRVINNRTYTLSFFRKIQYRIIMFLLYGMKRRFVNLIKSFPERRYRITSSW
jgi:hypothetical protein